MAVQAVSPSQCFFLALLNEPPNWAILPQPHAKTCAIPQRHASNRAHWAVRPGSALQESSTCKQHAHTHLRSADVLVQRRLDPKRLALLKHEVAFALRLGLESRQGPVDAGLRNRHKKTENKNKEGELLRTSRHTGR